MTATGGLYRPAYAGQCARLASLGNAAKFCRKYEVLRDAAVRQSPVYVIEPF